MNHVAVTPMAREGPALEADLEQYLRCLLLAFVGRSADAMRDWVVKAAGVDNVLLARDHAGAVMGGLILVPMGQFFGARPVPMQGVAGVAVAPEARGKGAALALMRAAVHAARARGAALSALYPALQELYRLVGFEQAGSRFETAVPGRLIAVRGREKGLHVRRALDPDRDAVRDLYARLARHTDGMLDRREYIWGRVKDFRGAKAEGFVIAPGEGPPEAYVYFSQASTNHPTLRNTLTIHDAAAATPRAARHLLGFLADHRSMTETVLWHGPSAGPLHVALPEQVYTVRLHEHWMLRVLDAPAAVAARGYPRGLSLDVPLRIDDDLVPDNAGDWTLRVEDGRGSLQRAAPHPSPARVSARGLAPLYSGFLGAHALRCAGLADGPDEHLAALEAAFRASPGGPAMVDFF